MRLILFNPKSGKVFQAETLSELVAITGECDFDYKNRKVTVGYAKLIASFSTEYSAKELKAEFANAALKALVKYGWVLYKKVHV
jgi:hypothetical protein